MTECLSYLLAPLSTDSFLMHYQAREHFYVARSSPYYYVDLLGITDIDTILQSRMPAALINVVKDGVRRPLEEWSRFVPSARGMHQITVPEKLLSLYADGATLILNQADAVLPALGDACRKVTEESGFPTQTNIYITPSHSAGFSRHADEHDVLILQVAGSKSWRVYTPDATQEINLESGDLLYIPRGMFHDARSQDADSIHITLGLRPAYAFELIRDLATVAAELEKFQMPMPPRFAGAEAMQLFEAEFRAGLQALIADLKPSTLTDLNCNRMAAYQAEAWHGRFADLRLLSRMSPDTVVGRRAERPAAVKDDGKFLHISFADRHVTIPVFMRDQLPRILGDGNFAIGDIQGMITNSGRVKLVAELVKAGFLRIVNI